MDNDYVKDWWQKNNKTDQQDRNIVLHRNTEVSTRIPITANGVVALGRKYFACVFCNKVKSAY
jgi:hypothetical protein